jgi:hypothetical protein
MAALTAGIQGLVAIIQNQLTAAWNAFLEKTMYIWVFFKKIYDIVAMIGSSLIEGLGGIFSQLMNMAGAKITFVSNMLKSLSGGQTDLGGFVKTSIVMIATVIDHMITGIATWVMRFMAWGDRWLSDLMVTFGLLTKYTVSKKAGDAMIEAGQQLKTDADPEAKIKELENKRDERISELVKALDVNSEKLSETAKKDKQGANNRSGRVAGQQRGILAELTKEFAAGQMFNKMQQDKLAGQQMANTKGKSSPRIEETLVRESFILKLSALVGSIQSATTNKFLKETASQVDEQKKTNELLKEQNRIIQTQGAF